MSTIANQSICATVIEVVAAALQLPAEVLTLESSMETVERWDSLHHLNVLLDIEQRFHITLTLDEIVQLNSVLAIVEVLQTRLASRATSTSDLPGK